MASRRLVQRSRQNEESSPAPRARQQSLHPGTQQRGASARPQSTPLPPYEPPSCPLSAEARRELDHLRLNHDYIKYKLHIRTGKANLVGTTADSFDRVRLRKEKAEKEANRRRKAGENQKGEEEIEATRRAKALEVQVLEVRKRAEKAMRELIDYEDELAMNDTIMKDMIANIPPPPIRQPVRLPRVRNDEDGSDDDNAADQDNEGIYEVPDVAGVSTLELLRTGREEYTNSYTSKSMRARYENTDYATFIRTIHSTQHGDDVPPPHARSWFKEDGQPAAASGSNGANADEDDVSDEDIVIARASVNLKCPLTLQYFKQPYSNNVCNHSFEKDAILDYYRHNGAPVQARDARGRPIGRPGPKKVTCPQSGCNKEFDPSNFFDDKLLARQVKRAQQEEAREDDEDEDDDDDESTAAGTQRLRPAQVASDDEDIEVDDEEEQRKQHALKVKRERGKSRGLSVAPSMPDNGSMELDEEEEDEDEDEDME